MIDPPVSYRVQPLHPEAHRFAVRCMVARPDPAGQRFSLPAWIPGSYLIRDFARHIVNLSAHAAGRPVAVAKHDKQTWVCAPCEGPLTLEYEVYAWDLSVRAAHLDATHGYFNGPSVLLMTEGSAHHPSHLELAPPPGEAAPRWRVATAMRRDGAAPFGFGGYRADNYDELIDHPIEMGDFTVATFSACGVPHDVVISGRHRADRDRLGADLQRICEHHIRFFGEPAPMERYVFLITAVGEGYGGLEHRASTSLLCSRHDLPLPGDKDVSDRYRTFLALASHEYFHAWHVKRIKPAAFIPYRLDREVYTRLLWAFEGITSYYDALALVRAGLITPEAYLEMLAQTITRLLRTPGRHKQTVEESSFDAWIKLYQPNENTPNAIVSYYTKGAVVALALDLTIRAGTQSRVALDDVMRALWTQYGRTGRGVPEDGVERLAQKISGIDLRAFFDQALRSTDELPLDTLLADLGVRFTLRPAESDQDKGGKPAAPAPPREHPTWGVRLADDGGDAKLAHVFDDGPAQRAGLAAGDVILAVDGLRVTRGNWASLTGGYAAGATIRVHAFRRDELMECRVTLDPAPADTCVLSMAEPVDEKTLARRTAWLTSRRS